MMKKEERLFYLLLYILFLLDTFAAFIDFLVCMYVIVVLSTISFVIIRLSRHCCFIHYFETTYAAVVGNFIVCQFRTSCYQNFSVKPRCNHFPFFEVSSIGLCPHVIVFHFGERFQTCPVLVTVFMGHVGTEGKNRKTETFKGKLIHVDEAL